MAITIRMKYNAYANIRDNKVNIDVVKQTSKRLKRSKDLFYKIEYVRTHTLNSTWKHIECVLFDTPLPFDIKLILQYHLTRRE